MSECDGSDGEVLMSGVVSVRVEVTDPSDGQVHVYKEGQKVDTIKYEDSSYEFIFVHCTT